MLLAKIVAISVMEKWASEAFKIGPILSNLKDQNPIEGVTIHFDWKTASRTSSRPDWLIGTYLSKTQFGPTASIFGGNWGHLESWYPIVGRPQKRGYRERIGTCRFGSDFGHAGRFGPKFGFANSPNKCR